MAGKFEPKVPVTLNPPKDDPITVEHLSKCNGKFPGFNRQWHTIHNFTLNH